jgi:hypothetical protein
MWNHAEEVHNIVYADSILPLEAVLFANVKKI